jgi:VWFA-related protein
MKERFFLILLTAFSLLTSAAGRQQPPAAAQQDGSTKEKKQQTAANRKNQDEVVRISVTLVQVDVSATDKKGRPIPDLKPEDFEVYEDGQRQQITNFSYVSSSESAGTSEASRGEARAKDKPNAPPPPAQLKPNQVRRTIALVVDDLTLSLESTPYVQQALRKFVDEQMQQGDLVAIVRTGAGMGALQTFTADRRILYAAIERVRWSPSSGPLYSFAPVTTNVADLNRLSAVDGKLSSSSDDRFLKTPDKASGELDKFRQEVFSVGTLGALQFVVRALRELPGRKSVVLFSEGLRIYNREQNIIRVRDALRNLVDMANRSSTVIYTIDARGVQPLTITAGDDLSGDLTGGTVDQTSWLFEAGAHTAARFDAFIESQQGLNYLAQQTGGFFIKNNNDLNGGVRRVMKDQDSYYLIGFVPEASTFKGGKERAFHNLTVKASRPDVRIRTRSGFFGITDEEAKPLEKTFKQSLLTALTSPFNSGEIGLRLTSMLGLDPRQGSFVSSLLHIDANDLTFAQETNGQRKASFEIAAFTFGDNGRVIDQNVRRYEVRMTEREYEHTLKAGVFYRVNLPIKKPGAYQLRTAVRDAASLKVGSANQFIEVPDIKKGRLVLSGIMVRGGPVETARRASATVQPAARMTSTVEGKVEEESPQAGPAVRRLTRGMALEYACMIYGARLDKTTHRPQLETQLRVFRDGKQVFEGKVNSFDPGQQNDSTRLVAGGSFLLGSELQPGEYVLQFIVTDKLANKKEQIATNWIDFEIVR